MIENYKDKVTEYAESQKNLANNETHKYIPPNYNVNGNINTVPSTQTSSGNSSYSVYNDPNTYEGFFFYIFNKTTIIYFLWFLAIYIIAYYVLGFFRTDGYVVSNELKISRIIDIIALILLLLALLGYSTLSPDEQIKSAEESLNYFKKDMTSPGAIIIQILGIAIFYLVIYLFKIPMGSGVKSITVSIIETTMWLYLIVQIFSVFFKYVIGVSLYDVLSKYFNWSELPDYAPVPKPSGNVNIKGNINLGSPIQKDEVFNISNNLYTYDDAQAICSSYGAKTATYDQIEEAYKNGAEWCNYGWSDGQMAFFPTQKSTWEKLQKTDKHKNDCGRPGINGGYFANPYIRFGVNCYGKKPQPKNSDLERMKAQNNISYPKTEKDNLLDRKAQFWKDNADKMLVLNSFNKNVWSEY
jgi:hypothetical protein